MSNNYKYNSADKKIGICMRSHSVGGRSKKWSRGYFIFGGTLMSEPLFTVLRLFWSISYCG